MALTPEEQKELAELEAMEASGELLAPQPLSSEEEAELAELEALEAQGALKKEPEYSPVQSGLMGAAQGATLGFADEIGGAVKTAAQTLTGDVSFSQLSQQYEANRDVLRKEFSQAEQENPGSFMTGDIAAGAASMLIPAGLVGNVVKGGLKGAVALGAASGLGRSEEEEIQDQLVDSLTGGALGAAGFGAGKLVGKGFEKLGKVANSEAGQAMRRALGFTSISSKKSLDKIAQSKGYKGAEVLNEIIDEVDDTGSKIFSPMKSTEEIFEGVEMATDKYGKAIGEVLSEVDQTIGGPSIDPNYVVHRLKNGALKEFLNSDSESVAKSAQGFIDDLIAPSSMQQPWTMSRLWGFRKTIDSITKHNSQGGAEINTNLLKRKARAEVENILREGMESIPEAKAIGALDIYKQASNKYRLFRTTQDAMYDNIIIKEEGVVGALRKSLHLGGLGLGSFAGGSVAGAPGIVVGGILGRMAARGSGDLMLSSTLRKAGALASTNNNYAQKILTAASISGPALEKAIAYGESITDLSLEKLPRSTEAVRSQAPKILSILEEENPVVAKMLRQAIDNEDDALIQGIMSQLSLESKGKNFIQDGIGWDGKAISEGDIKTVESMIKSASMSSTKKAQLMQKFKQDKMIPELQGEEEKPFFKVYDPNLKTKVMR